MELNQIYVDENFLAVNKPAGLAAVPGGWEADVPALVKLLEADFGRVWTVHRLDKGTSGVVLFARTAAAHRTLSLLFETHAVRKTYLAIVVGIPQWDEHTARHPLRINVGHSHRTVVDHAKGKPSETAFRVLERFTDHSLLEARPATGRTHQVRVHAYALGFPLLGDELYGQPSIERDAKVPRRGVPLHRPALHAVSLEFEFEGKPFSFTAPHPK
ncbi:MAG: RluA family pseudouridine synthase, partial [Chloroflexi bacterium]|nr:RluA family pseudouridine synthase [Chloroflexota bacterium]